jgi:hypothetical protein
LRRPDSFIEHDTAASTDQTKTKTTQSKRIDEKISSSKNNGGALHGYVRGDAVAGYRIWIPVWIHAFPGKLFGQFIEFVASK